MALTKKQKEQVVMQLKKHNRGDVKGKITLEPNKEFELIVEKGVFGSDIMSSGIYLAKFLYNHKKLYFKKICLDMGCGPGIQGLIMAKYGARQVDLSDINRKAVENTKKNIKLHNLKMKASVYVSDLFKNLPDRGKYDIIVFNHPFFPEEAERFGKEVFKETMLRKSMLGGTELVKQFFRNAKNYLKDKNSLIIMPYFHFAGKENDPANHVKDYGFYISKEERIKSEQGLQLGDFSIYIIKKIHWLLPN